MSRVVGGPGGGRGAIDIGGGRRPIPWSLVAHLAQHMMAVHAPGVCGRAEGQVPEFGRGHPDRGGDVDRGD